MWEQLPSGRVRHRFEPLVIAATLALIPVFVIEAEASSSVLKDVAFAANWLIWLIFAAELAFTAGADGDEWDCVPLRLAAHVARDRDRGGGPVAGH